MGGCCDGKRSAFGYYSFFAHHLYEGAEVIFIYLDKPDVEVIAALKLCLRPKSFPLTMHISHLKERAQRILNETIS